MAGHKLLEIKPVNIRCRTRRYLPKVIKYYSRTRALLKTIVIMVIIRLIKLMVKQTII